MLDFFADGRVVDVRDKTVLDPATVQALYRDGLLTALDASNQDGPAFLQVSITQRGIEVLEQRHKELSKKTTREARYVKNHPIAVKVLVGVTVAQTILVVTQLLRFWQLLPFVSP